MAKKKLTAEQRAKRQAERDARVNPTALLLDDELRSTERALVRSECEAAGCAGEPVQHEQEVNDGFVRVRTWCPVCDRGREVDTREGASG